MPAAVLKNLLFHDLLENSLERIQFAQIGWSVLLFYDVMLEFILEIKRINAAYLDPKHLL